MEPLEDKYACLLPAPSLTVTELAQQLLSGAGIPSLVHGPGFDPAELGAGRTDDALHRHSLFVNRTDLERAKEVLHKAWGDLEGPKADGAKRKG